MGCGASTANGAAAPVGVQAATNNAAAAPAAPVKPAAAATGGAYPPHAVCDTLKDLPDWIKAGCGNESYHCEEKNAVFPADKCPEALPDLSQHGNILAATLRDRPELYEKYKNVTTPGGVSLAACIKTGIDNPGHPHILTCGLVAGDEHCFETFKEVFDEVIGKRNGGYPADGKHVSDMDVTKLSHTKIDPTGKYVLTTRCRTGRSVRGLPLPPSCSFEQRRETERVVVKGLMKMEGELKGQYFPLHGSRSMDDAKKSEPAFASIHAMDHAKEEGLRKGGNLFQEPDSTLLLSSGCGRHWPDARGIYHNEAENFFVWVNEEDQMRIVSMEKGDNIRAIFTRFANATGAVQDCLKAEGYDFMHSDHLGYILTCPSNLGTGLRAGAMVTVPLFSARADFKDTLKKMKLQARGTAGVDSASTGGTWDISNADRLGYSEVQLCNLFIEGLAQIIRWEQALEAGKDIEAEVAAARPMGLENYPPVTLSETVSGLPEWIKLGCGNGEYYCPEKGAVFPGDKCPDSLPDLSNHGNLCAMALRDHPELYAKYKDVTTPGGVTLAKCIKTGIDNPGHPHILTCGLVAGDEDCYTTFKDLFDVVVGKRNGDYAPDAVHTTDMDVSKLSDTKIDPDGKYVLTTRCRTGRSVRGLPLPPSCSFEQRRETERVVVKGLLKMGGELAGSYHPLNGSLSMEEAKKSEPAFENIVAMNHGKEEGLRKGGNLFQEPDSTLLLSSGCGRHWPDARGIFHNEAENFFVWVNEEDQIRIVSMEKGDDIKAIFTRFANATSAVQECLVSEGYDFQHSEHLGYILTCPSNLGTGLRAGAMVQVPLFSARADFKDILRKMKLQARGTAGVDSASTGGTWDISNADRLGFSEVQLCNLFIEGIAQVIRWEKALEAGEDIEAEVAEAKPLGI